MLFKKSLKEKYGYCRLMVKNISVENVNADNLNALVPIYTYELKNIYVENE